MTDTLPNNFGQYLVTRLLGESNLGHTYLAKHQLLEIEVAVKVLDKVQLEKDDRKLLASNARTLLHMSNPSLNRLYDFGMEGEHVYYVYAYIDRGTLRDVYPAGYKLSEKKVASLMHQLVKGLQPIHDAGLLHGNISFNNILVDENNTLIWTDIGIIPALLQNHWGEQKQWSNPSYHAPELFKQEGILTKASEVYSLGAIAYELITGSNLYNDSYDEVENIHNEDKVPVINCRTLHVTQKVQDTVLRSLEHEPEKRQPSIASFANDLTQYACLDDELLDEDEESEEIRFVRGMTLTVLASRTNQSIIDVSWSPDGEHLACLEQNADSEYDCNRKKTLHIWNTNKGILEHSLDEGNRAKAVGWTKEGDIISTGWSSKISYWDCTTGERKYEIPSPAKRDKSISDMVISPTKDIAAICPYDRESIHFLNLERREFISEYPTSCFQLSWSPDGKKCVYTDNTNVIKIMNPDNGSQTGCYTEHRHHPIDVAWSPDGRKIASVCSWQISVWNPRTRKTLIQIDRFNANFALTNSVYWLSDNIRLAFINKGEGIRIWNTETNEIEYVYSGHSSDVTILSISPDGRKIASGDMHGIVHIWSAY